MAEPPFDAGAVQLTVAEPLPATAVTPVGAPGASEMVTAAQMADMLRLLGHTVVIMFSPRTAIHQLSEVVPDVIFIDINLPGVDGFEVCRYIRRDPNLSHLPIVIVSSHDDDTHRSLARMAGADRYLNKPVTIDQLRDTLAEVVDLAKSQPRRF